MACIRKRRGKYVVDYRDGAGIRRWVTCAIRREAEAIMDKVRDARRPTRPVVDPNIAVTAYAERWLATIGATVKLRTRESYAQTLRLHILPAVGTMRVRLLHRGLIKAWLVEKLRAGKVKKVVEGGITKEVRLPLARDSVRIILATLRALLNAAVEDGIVVANPSNRLGRQLRLVPVAQARQEEIKAMTRAQVSTFLVTSLSASTAYERRHYPLFLLLARTGMRLGEALALWWDDVDFGAREIRVVRTLSAGRVETPKSGHGRSVDMSEQLAKVLLRLHVERKAETLKRSWSRMPPWIFCTDAATSLDDSKVRKVFGKTLKAAVLPPHFTPHCLRHTFASLLLQQGESPAYVQRQLGHASIELTVDTYGKWLPMGNKAAVNRLDDQSGSKTVASRRAGGGENPGSAREQWSRGRDLNPRPADYESAALPLSYPGLGPNTIKHVRDAR
jgi:integrase